MKSKMHDLIKNNRNLVSKNLFLSIALVFATLFGFAQEEAEDEGITITVIIDNVKNDTGKVIMSLHNSETWMKGSGVMSTESEIKDGKVTVTFENVQPGDYAVMALHDENENKRMDFEDSGMPKESYGMSNNVMSFGPPQYDDAKFEVADEDLELNIRL